MSAVAEGAGTTRLQDVEPHQLREAPGDTPSEYRMLPLEPEPDTQLLPALRRPGLIERVLAGLTILVFYHQTPNAWLVHVDDLTAVDYSNPLASLTTLSLLGLAVSRVAGHINLLIRLVRMEPAVFLLAGLAFVSMFWSADPSSSMRRGIIFLFVTFFAGYLVLRFALNELILIFGATFTASAILNLAFVSVYPVFGIDEDGLWTGVFAAKNGLGYVAALGIPTLLIAARTYPRVRLLFYIATGIEVVLLIQSDSKTMLVAAVLPTLLMLIYHGFRARRTLPGAVFISLIGGSLFALAFGTANIGVLASWLDKDITLTGRVPLWEGLFPVIAERPWFGQGYSASFGGYFSPVHDIWIHNQWAGDAHNAYIQLLLDLGVVGLILFVFSFLRALVRSVTIVALVPGAVGLWPLVIMSQALLMSATESGMQSDSMGWTIYLVAVFTAAAHLSHRLNLGLTNSLRAAIRANRDKLIAR